MKNNPPNDALVIIRGTGQLAVVIGNSDCPCDSCAYVKVHHAGLYSYTIYKPRSLRYATDADIMAATLTDDPTLAMYKFLTEK